MPLVFVPTPLGNLGDITLRALETLRNADLVVAEDTRVARMLLHALQIASKELWSYREQNAASVTNGILERARGAARRRRQRRGDAGDLRSGQRAGCVPPVRPASPSRCCRGRAPRSAWPCFRASRCGASRSKASPRARAARGEPRSGTLLPKSARRSGTSRRSGSLRRSRISRRSRPKRTVFLVREYTKKFEQQILERRPRWPHGSRSRCAARFPSPSSRWPAPNRRYDRDPARQSTNSSAGGASVRDIAKQLAERGYGEKRELYNQASARKRARGMGASAAAEDESSE